MSLRRSPLLTPAALAARRANARKSTGPRSARGKAWSCLNALCHGRRSRRLRDKIERTGDFEALYLYDWLHSEIEQLCDRPRDWHWGRIEGLTVRAWCILTGREPRWRVKDDLRTKLECGVRLMRYADALMVPNRLKIINRSGCGLLLVSAAPWRRRRVNLAWVPEVIHLEGRPPKARRVRRAAKPAEAAAMMTGALGLAPPGSHPFRPQNASKRVTSHDDTTTYSPIRLSSFLSSGGAGYDGGPDSA
jgi:hypothetical protein